MDVELQKNCAFFIEIRIEGYQSCALKELVANLIGQLLTHPLRRLYLNRDCDMTPLRLRPMGVRTWRRRRETLRRSHKKELSAIEKAQAVAVEDLLKTRLRSRARIYFPH